LDKIDLNKRLLLAFALSFMVFVALEYFIQQSVPKDNNTTIHTSSATTITPEVIVKADGDKSTPKIVKTTEETLKNTPMNKKLLPIITTINSKEFSLEIDNLGRISQFKLLAEKYKTDENKILKLFDMSKTKALEIRFSDPRLNKEAFEIDYKASESIINLNNKSATVVLTQTLSTNTVTKTLTFYPDGHYDLDIQLSKNEDYFLTTGYRPIADKSKFMIVKGALIKDADNIINTVEDGDALGNEQFKGASIASAFDRYYTSLLYNFDKGMSVSLLKDSEDNPLIFIQGEQNLKLNGYIGAKDYRVLHNINPALVDAIEYGWFTFLSKPFFAVTIWIHDIVGNWGWAIILFTLLVKLILFPLSYKGMMSMQKLKDLAPKMKEIKEKYGKEPQKMNQHMMELYGKHNANPMGGCLPMLLQIPVFFALYRVLLNAVELQGASWILWIEDLSKMDPYFILPILMGASMYLQQKLTPTTITDPLQQKIFMYLPLVMTVFFITFPSGLVLYWLVNNIFSITQQYYINGVYEKNKVLEIEAHKKTKDK